MKLTYYGTAAAGGFPGFYCEDDLCMKVRNVGGRNIRTRSQAMVDDKILIDHPQDTYLHVCMYGLPIHKINNIIITHNHPDHLYVEDLFLRRKGFADLKNPTPLKIYGSTAVIETIQLTEERKNMVERMLEQNTIALHEITLFEPFYVEGYKVTALNASHSASQSMMYMLEKDNKAMLYAHDTGLFPDCTMEYLKDIKVHFDLVSFDCTNGILQLSENNHMGLNGNIIMRERLLNIGCIRKDTRCILNHFSHKCGVCYDDFVPIAAEKGFEVSYDAMVAEF